MPPPSRPARILLVGGRLLDAGGEVGTAFETAGGRITWTGTTAQARGRGAGAGVLDLAGATVTPAFVDAHVHVTAAGLLADGLDLTACPDATALLDAVAARAAARPGTLVWGHGWQDGGWAVPPRAALDRAGAGAPVYLSRVDAHSALVSSALLDRAPGAVGAAGWTTTGALTAEAHHHVRRAALAAIDGRTRDAAQTAFLADAARRGVGVVHECAGPDISGADDLGALLARPGVEVVGYWGEAVRTAADARDLIVRTGARGLAGDLFVDGSLGSRTAALRAPYRDAQGCTGNRYLDPDTVAAHVAACTAAGIQAGFHVIGDAAADALIEGLAAAGEPAALRARAHRVEHLEMIDAGQAAALAARGVVASVQPAFDAAWGGPDGLYAARLGHRRAEPMNPLALLRDAGVVLALGSDAPVTPVDPWGALRAATHHRTARSAVRPADALAAHTVGGYRAAGDVSPLAGRLLRGAAASYAVWDGGGVLDGEPDDPACLRTVHRGEVLHDLLQH
ncbi:MAG TPA: amidohydrolase family protein [Pseudonocardia sp.]|jgi:predicted amidohydrolase YtcJ|nr:amidohydrolase family protein [Pseudonocardia sp.]